MTLLYSCSRKTVLTMRIFWSGSFVFGLPFGLPLKPACFFKFAC